MKVPINELRSLVSAALHNYGYATKEAEVIEDVLLYAQLRGNNQGIVKLIGKGIPKPADVGEIAILRDTPLSCLVDGQHNHAMVVVGRATDLAIQKAKDRGVAVVGANHIETSSGAIGFYARKIAAEGLIGIVLAGSPPTVAADGSYEAIFGTNPLAIAIPTTGEPLVLDMATAAMPYYGVIEANTAGRELPDSIAYDKEGNLTTIPAKVLDGGALRTFDKSHRGTGLSMMVQVLTGPLVGSAFSGIGDAAGNGNGHCIIAIDPELLGGLDAVREGVTALVGKVKATKKLPGIAEIFVPGERGDRMTKAAMDANQIEIEDNLYLELTKAAAQR